MEYVVLMELDWFYHADYMVDLSLTMSTHSDSHGDARRIVTLDRNGDQRSQRSNNEKHIHVSHQYSSRFSVLSRCACDSILRRTIYLLSTAIVAMKTDIDDNIIILYRSNYKVSARAQY
jgi:hypothetical protein